MKNKLIIIYKKRVVGPFESIKELNIGSIKKFIEDNHEQLPENTMVHDPYSDNDIVVFNLMNNTVYDIKH